MAVNYFSQTVQEHLAGRVVRAAVLVHFDFAGAPTRVWPGRGPLVTGDGHTWLGIGAWGTADDFKVGASGTAAHQQTFRLSGVRGDDGVEVELPREVFSLARQERRAAYFGRSATAYWQFFREDWSVLDGPYPFWAGRMWAMNFRSSGDSRVVELQCESILTRRRRPSARYYSDADQQMIHPGDTIFQLMPVLPDKQVRWPT